MSPGPPGERRAFPSKSQASRSERRNVQGEFQKDRINHIDARMQQEAGCQTLSTKTCAGLTDLLRVSCFSDEQRAFPYSSSRRGASRQVCRWCTCTQKDRKRMHKER
mmetsp:Transcript_241/g.603  ORF Transcript_241/g.603 Transcript_241/m.603 type:complete len:107 (+) Transcript_241:1160-1480(+)